MEWLWMVIAMAVAGGVTFLITKYGLSGKIGELTGKADAIQVAVMDVYVALSSAMKADEDGSVRLTADEVTAIKMAVGKLLAIFGITLPI